MGMTAKDLKAAKKELLSQKVEGTSPDIVPASTDKELEEISNLLDEVEKEQRTEDHGIVARGKKVLDYLLQKRPDGIPYGTFSSVLSKKEGKKIEYSVIQYVIERSRWKAEYLAFKKAGENWVKRK